MRILSLCFKRFRSATFSLAVMGLLLSFGDVERVSAEEGLEDLTDGQYEAMEEINEKSVTGTISFLASDELGGRGTPSKEFEIAAAYVASRLRAAGAVGLGPDGSYFLEEEIDVTRTPSNGFQIQATDSSDLIRYELLSATDVPLDYKGKIVSFAPDDDPGNVNDRVAFIPFPVTDDDFADRYLQVQRSVQILASSGAKAVLIEAPAGNETLWKLCEYRQGKAEMAPRRGRGGMPCPVFVVGSLPDGATEYVIRSPALIKTKATVMNVCGVIRGSDEELSKEAVVFSAHLDHLGRAATGEGDTVFNGADDDASGVTAVVTLADAYGALEEAPKRSVVFLALWGEERGLLGSKSFVESPAWPLEEIVANVNIEMIGRPEEGARNKMWMTGWDKSDLGTAFNDGSRRIGVETFNHSQFSPMLYNRSDNYAFAQKGVVAHSFSAGSLHGDYHQLSDEWSKLDLTHMTQVIRGLFAGSLPIADGEVTPAQAD